jgi:adenosylhomocysteine nucleosidase
MEKCNNRSFVMEYITDKDVLGMVVAMDIEARPIINHYDLIEEQKQGFSVYTNQKIRLIVSGVGIINSTLATYILIHDLNCTNVINYGVAGFTGDLHQQRSVFTIGKVYKRDVDFTALGYERYHFPDKPKYIKLKTDDRLTTLDCYTSDEYIGPKSVVPKNVLVDMEGYCVANVCKRYEIPCMIYKSISDNTFENDTQGQIDTHLLGAVSAICDFIIYNVME